MIVLALKNTTLFLCFLYLVKPPECWVSGPLLVSLPYFLHLISSHIFLPLQSLFLWSMTALWDWLLQPSPMWSTCLCSELPSIHFAHLCQILYFYSPDLHYSPNPTELCPNFFSKHLKSLSWATFQLLFQLYLHISSTVTLNFSQNILIIITLANFKLQHTYPFVHAISIT